MLLHRQLHRSVSRHQTVDLNSTATDMKRMLRDPFISIPIVMNRSLDLKIVIEFLLHL